MRTTGLLLMTFVLTCTSYLQGAESYHVIKIKTWNKEVAYEVMSETQLNESLRELQNLARVTSTAAALAQEEWRKDATNGRKPFPPRVLMPLTYAKVGSFEKEDAAKDKCARLEDRQREKEMAEKKAKKGSKKGVQDLAREARDAAADNREIMARALFERMLTEVLESKAAAAPAAKAAPDGQ